MSQLQANREEPTQQENLVGLDKSGPFGGILFLGGGSLLLNLVKWAHTQGLTVRVLTDPRHAKGRPDTSLTLSEELDLLDIPWLETSSLDAPAATEFILEDCSLLSLSIGASWIFSKSQLDALFSRGLLNLHGTPLPEYRGGGGVSWQILMGDMRGAVTIHYVDAGIDTGPIVFSHRFTYAPRCEVPIDFQSQYTTEAMKVIPTFLTSLIVGAYSAEIQEQVDASSTYWPRLSTPLNGWVNWDWAGRDLERFIRAFDDPYEGASTYWRRGHVRLKSCRLHAGDDQFHPFQAGLVFRRAPGRIFVAVRGGFLEVGGVFNGAGDAIVDDVGVGDRLSTPSRLLERALERPRFVPD